MLENNITEHYEAAKSDYHEEEAEDEVFRVNIWDTDDQPVMKGLKEKSLHHAFVDLIEEYIKVLIGSRFQTWTLYKNQIHHKLPLHMITLVMKTHNLGILIPPLTSSQVVHPFLLLLNWLHWHYCII